MNEVRVSIIGATGYAGVELARILVRHPKVKITAMTSDSYKDMPIDQVFGHLRPQMHRLPSRLVGHGDSDALSAADVVFTSLPHGHAMKIAERIVEEGKYLIDLGADFRLKDASVFRSWYGTEHTCPDMLSGAVYGLPEINRSRISSLGATGKSGGGRNSTGRIIANPGCYPTSVILGLAPLVQAGLVPQRGVVIDSKSGVSGAGRGLSLKTHYCEANENISAYNVAGAHRHIPEMEQELSALGKKGIKICFSPHLCPMSRGILSTIYVPVGPDVSGEKGSEGSVLVGNGEAGNDGRLNGKSAEETVYDLYQSFYEDEPFVDVLPPGLPSGTGKRGGENLPRVKDVSGTNVCRIGMEFDYRTSTIVLISVIDNLIKGAAGQAVQNMNVLLGFEETEGLLMAPAYP